MDVMSRIEHMLFGHHVAGDRFALAAAAQQTHGRPEESQKEKESNVHHGTHFGARAEIGRGCLKLP